MSTRKAKILEDHDLDKVLDKIDTESPNPIRDKLAVMLTAKAGLRAVEVAGLRWEHVTKADGTLDNVIHLTSDITKGGKERMVPMNTKLMDLLKRHRLTEGKSDRIIRFSLRSKDPAHALVMWFSRIYKSAGLQGCSSHSGRRTFITKLARNLDKHNCSLVDIQKLVGHSNLETTAMYIEVQKRVRGLVDDA